MARIGVVAAMPVEIEDIIGSFGAKEHAAKGIYKLYKGVYAGHEVILACCSVGKVNAAACTQKLIDTFAVDFIINMGIAGAIDEKLRTLDVVIGSELFYHDFSPRELLDKYYPNAQFYKCDDKLMELAEKTCASYPGGIHAVRGRIATGDCFVETAQAREKIRAAGGICCEMEGAAIGHVCYSNRVPFLILRSISDLADEDAQMTYDEFERRAAIQSNRIVEGILSLLK